MMKCVWLTAGAACALFGCVDVDPEPAVQDGLIGEFEHAAPDGAAYKFRFSVIDGVVVKEVFTPAGQPPPVDDECALDTFLRVAPDDAEVPTVLRQSCARHDVAALRARATVGELRRVGLVLELSNGSGPACTESAYNARYNTLVTAAGYVPTVNLPTGIAPDAYYLLGGDGSCSVYDAHTGAFKYWCDPTQIPDDGPPGWWQWHTTYTPGPDPDCAHNISSWGAFSPSWLDWQVSTPTSTVASARFEVSACSSAGQSSATWQTRRHTTDAWGTIHATVWSGAGLYQLSFDSGTTSGNWAGNQYQFQAHGNGVRPMYAGARMRDLDRSECPSHLL